MPKRWNQKSFAHKMVAELQVEMAQTLYEELAKSNQFYKDWPASKRNQWVKACAPTLRDHARSTLAEMLGHHDLTPQEKEDIYQALLLDATIPNEDRLHIPTVPWLH